MPVTTATEWINANCTMVVAVLVILVVFLVYHFYSAEPCNKDSMSNKAPLGWALINSSGGAVNRLTTQDQVYFDRYVTSPRVERMGASGRGSAVPANDVARARLIALGINPDNCGQGDSSSDPWEWVQQRAQEQKVDSDPRSSEGFASYDDAMLTQAMTFNK